jgi:hypothetical protein
VNLPVRFWLISTAMVFATGHAAALVAQSSAPPNSRLPAQTDPTTVMQDDGVMQKILKSVRIAEARKTGVATVPVNTITTPEQKLQFVTGQLEVAPFRS